MTAAGLLDQYRRGQVSPVEVVAAVEERAAEVEPTFNTLTATAFEQARADAAASAARYAEGRPLPLDGVPVVVKDMIDTAGLRTTYGSKMFVDHVPHDDAPVVAALRAAGAVVVGKAATHEFAWGITTDNAHFGPTRNPRSPAHVPGGSSGGSGAALAAGLVPLALGTDTVGSVRIPAAFCGVVGLRPTYGLVDTTGVFPLAPSFDVVGPMAATVADVRLLLGAMAPVGGARASARIGVCPDLDQLPLGPWARAGLDAALRLAGDVATVAFPDAPPLFETASTIVLAEALHTHRRAGLWPSRADDYSDELRPRFASAEAVNLPRYLDAQEARRRLMRTVAGLFEEVDVLLSAVSTVAPLPIGADPTGFREAVMTCTALQSLCGLPACVVPVGVDAEGLPTAVQVTGACGADALVLDAAERLQSHLQ
ncbi:MAG TPA: amidase [Acidimicrobiales bacterium]|nr:amidase [Acidimicrobiales bacterium]